MLLLLAFGYLALIQNTRILVAGQEFGDNFDAPLFLPPQDPEYLQVRPPDQPCTCDTTCPSTLTWGSWEAWSETCTGTCDDRLQERYRSCPGVNGACAGQCDPVRGGPEERRCLVQGTCCFNWQKWSECIGTCGLGKQIRSRVCVTYGTDILTPITSNSETQEQSCDLNNGCTTVLGNWDETDCTSSDSSGRRARILTNGGLCAGASIEYEDCPLPYLPNENGFRCLEFEPLPVDGPEFPEIPWKENFPATPAPTELTVSANDPLPVLIYPGTEEREPFVKVVTTFFKAPEDGDYTFTVKADPTTAVNVFDGSWERPRLGASPYMINEPFTEPITGQTEGSVAETATGTGTGSGIGQFAVLPQENSVEFTLSLLKDHHYLVSITHLHKYIVPPFPTTNVISFGLTGVSDTNEPIPISVDDLFHPVEV